MATLEGVVGLYGLRGFGYCLMPNHYHLLLETPQGNLSRSMGWFQSTYTIRFNRKYLRSGHLFQGRFKACLVDTDSYAKELLRYLHLNPVRPKDKSLGVPNDRRAYFEEYQWSSHRIYEGAESCPGWLDMGWLRYFGEEPLRALEEYREFVRQVAGGETLPWQA